MSTTVGRAPSPRAPSSRAPGARTWWVVGAAVAVTVLVRLPLLDLPAWADEAGFLMVGGGWRLGDPPDRGALYGSYWVDRPPVLITLYGLADRLGGLLALRLLGALAAAVTVACVAWVAHSVAGPRAAAWAALTGAALLSTPFHWSFMVDGEHLAAPFVAAGIGCVVRGSSTERWRGLALSAVGGACAAAALLTKQNHVDVFVFVAGVLLLGLLRRTLAPGAAARHAGAFGAGAAALGAAIGAWTVAHGTSLGAVYYAMYPFRLDVARSSASGAAAISWDRLQAMGVAALLSGLLVLAVWVTVAGVRRSQRDVHVLALLGVLAFDAVSVAVGTGYWLHYLVQPAVPVAVLTGILAARGSWVRVVSVGAAVTALVGWAVLVASPPQTAEELVGEAVGDAAAPGDTIVTILGRPNVVRAAGLPSPYPFLWALRVRTLDPGNAALEELLSGPRAPTWVVAFRPVRPQPSPGSVGAALATHYRPVARICGWRVLLHRDEERPRPTPRPRADATTDSRCESVAALPHVLRQLS